MDLKNSAIAIATDDGMTVSSHFGKARYYEVITLSDGKAVTRERREKAGHHSFAHGDGQTGHDRHHNEAHEQRHQAMTAPITDCTAVIVRGMGQGAVEHLRRANLIPILTGLHTIDEVLAAIAGGSIDNDPGRIHQHHGHS